MAKKWYVFYTKSRHEKKVNDLLLKRGFEAYLPLQIVLRQWSDRKRKVEVPLFSSYIFVFIEEHGIAEVLKVPGVSWNVRLNGKPAILQLEELETIRRFIATGLSIDTSVQNDEFLSGDRVKVIDGPLKGTIGVVTDIQSRRGFSVVLQSIGQVLTISIDRRILQKIS